MGTAKTESKTTSKNKTKRRGSGPVAFFLALFIVALGTIQLVATFHSYALNLAQLNGLKRQEAALIAKKQNLENDISRWNDDAYVTAQARERLGFVFPGEQAIHVEHPEAVTGVKPDSDQGKRNKANSDKKTLPWYSELAYGFKKADKPVRQPKDAGATVVTPSALGVQSGDGRQRDSVKTNQNTSDGETTRSSTGGNIVPSGSNLV
ncbi:FtsB family cell division protein [Bifidobacterium commune]|uniref:Cell division protein FtsB n=1 Tax=Bifidobacterium commune TaxID=1505727 RepID=A0A1C4H302_9BIFI|nr:septum formation initiator family protein [Bifidobacterium commune]SCC79183.1 Cell division protein FtsB [Bifidobacterium commune]